MIEMMIVNKMVAKIIQYALNQYYIIVTSIKNGNTELVSPYTDETIEAQRLKLFSQP